MAAWFYTGGKSPYGYRGLGEVSVFVFFGLVAVMGTAYVQMEEFSLAALWLGCGIGALACAILVANNLRDIPTDEVAGKRTLAVRMGDRRSRELFSSLHGAAFAFLVVSGIDLGTWWVLGGLIAFPLSIRAQAVVRQGADWAGPHPGPADDRAGRAAVCRLGLFLGLLVRRWRRATSSTASGVTASVVVFGLGAGLVGRLGPLGPGGDLG